MNHTSDCSREIGNRTRLAMACTAFSAVLLAGCGGGSDSGTSASGPASATSSSAQKATSEPLAETSQVASASDAALCD